MTSSHRRRYAASSSSFSFAAVAFHLTTLVALVGATPQPPPSCSTYTSGGCSGCISNTGSCGACKWCSTSNACVGTGMCGLCSVTKWTSCPSTPAPPTAVPSTARPSTAVPTTTAAPTTMTPTTTAAPSTSQPTTLSPGSTLQPTTATPSTLAPSTAEPTTGEPTTLVPSTEVPTTLVPSTEVPTTLVPTTAKPVTRSQSLTYSLNTTETPDDVISRTLTPSDSVVTQCIVQLSNTSLLATALLVKPMNASSSNTTASGDSDDSLPPGVIVVGAALSGTVFVTPLLPNVSDCLVFSDASFNNRNVSTGPVSPSVQRVLTMLNTHTLAFINDPMASSALLLISPSATSPLLPGEKDALIRVSFIPSCVQNRIICNTTLLVIAPPAPPPLTIITAAYQSGQVVATVGTLTTPSVAAVAQVNRISFSSALVLCDYSNEPLGFYQSPLNLKIGKSNVSYQNGAVIGNLVVLLIVLGVQFCIMGGIKARSHDLPNHALTSLARFPSFLVIPLLFVQQSMTTAATTIFVWGTDPLDYACGVVGVVVPAYSVFYTYSCIRTSSFRCSYLPSARRRSAVPRFFYGNGKWIDLDRSKQFKQRHQFMFTDYTDKCHWFMVVEMTMNVVCGLIEGLVYPDQCRNLLAAAVFAFLFFTLFAVIKRPYNSPWRALVSVGLCLIQLVAAACSWVGVYYRNDSAANLAGTLGVMCFYLLAIQAAVELIPKVQAFLKLGRVLKQWWRPGDYYDKNGALDRTDGGEEKDKSMELQIFDEEPLLKESELPVSDVSLSVALAPTAPPPTQQVPPPFVDQEPLASSSSVPNDDLFLDDLLTSASEVVLPPPPELHETAMEHDSLLLTVNLESPALQLRQRGMSVQRRPNRRVTIRLDQNTTTVFGGEPTSDITL